MKVLFVFDSVILGQEPLGSTQLSAILKQNGYECESINIDDSPDYIGEIVSYRPDILAFSCSTGQHPIFENVALAVKEKIDVLSVFGGPHPSYFPEVIEEDGVDVICRGEGEDAFLELVTAVAEGKDFTRIKNLWVKMPDGSIKKNLTRSYIQNLDTLPFTDKELVRKFPHIWRQNIGYFICGRGCPYDCNFCFNHLAMDLQDGKFVRYRSPGNMIEELKLTIPKYGFTSVAFQGDTFILNKHWLREFLPAYRDEVGLPFLCHVRADLINEEMAKMLAEANCIRAVFGLESGSDFIRNSVMNKRVDSKECVEASRLLRKYDIEIVTQNMFGVPHETVDSVWDTIGLNIECDAECMVLHFFCPYPRTGLAEYSAEQGFFDNDFEAIPKSNHWHMTLELEDRDLMESIAKLSWFFVDYPSAYKPARWLFDRLPSHNTKMAWLKTLNKLEPWVRSLPVKAKDSRWHPPKRISKIQPAILEGQPACI